MIYCFENAPMNTSIPWDHGSWGITNFQEWVEIYQTTEMGLSEIGLNNYIPLGKLYFATGE